MDSKVKARKSSKQGSISISKLLWSTSHVKLLGVTVHAMLSQHRAFSHVISYA